MRLKEFINKLPEGNWILTRIGAIRLMTETDRCCPITSILNKPVGDWLSCVIMLGIPRYIARYIVIAADYKDYEVTNTHPSNLIWLREILLNKLKLA